jgi:hypothetical protein
MKEMISVSGWLASEGLACCLTGGNQLANQLMANQLLVVVVVSGLALIIGIT